MDSSTVTLNNQHPDQVYDKLIIRTQNIAQKLDLPEEWVLIYFIAQNFPIQQFLHQSKGDSIYIPSKTQTSKIFVSNQTIRCELCQRNSKFMIRNICQHVFCYKCLKNYIYSFYANSQVKKTVLPLCLSQTNCNQMISHEIVNQILLKKQALHKEFKKQITNPFIKTQSANKIFFQE